MKIREIKLIDYTTTPSGRYKRHGKYSGEWFRDEILMPNIIDAEIKNEKIIINLNGFYKIPADFLDEVFGGLIRKYKYKNFSNLQIICNDDLGIIADIFSYVAEAQLLVFGKN